MNILEVKTSKLPFVLIGLLGLFFIPSGVWNLITAASNGFKTVPLFIGLMSLTIFGLVLWLVLRAHFKSVKYFTETGLMRNDKRTFEWANLNRVVNQTRINPRLGSAKFLWRTEIQFKDGESVWLIPTKIKNLREVLDFVNTLPCEHVEVRV